MESLKKEFEIGQSRLRELEKEEAYIRETMLRISGAIQVLQEISRRFETEGIGRGICPGWVAPGIALPGSRRIRRESLGSFHLVKNPV